MIVLGVDPGSVSCGLVVRRDNELFQHVTLTCDNRMPRQEWLKKCAGGAIYLADAYHVDLVAVEDVNTPNPHVRQKLIDPTPILSTAACAGAVIGAGWTRCLSVVLVPPGHNGQGPTLFYPAPLQPARGQGKGHDSLRHCRSAWDVAFAGSIIARGRVVA